VIVVGHADLGERNPDLLGRMRAEAAKEYLVRDRGIDEARVSVRSAAATRPLGSGGSGLTRARNRRVEIIFLPPGATAPEN
jgi:outer membrane protein OmpA-like peptidoglycan-associated protein